MVAEVKLKRKPTPPTTYLPAVGDAGASSFACRNGKRFLQFFLTLCDIKPKGKTCKQVLSSRLSLFSLKRIGALVGRSVSSMYYMLLLLPFPDIVAPTLCLTSACITNYLLHIICALFYLFWESASFCHRPRKQPLECRFGYRTAHHHLLHCSLQEEADAATCYYYDYLYSTTTTTSFVKLFAPS